MLPGSASTVLELSGLPPLQITSGSRVGEYVLTTDGHTAAIVSGRSVSYLTDAQFNLLLEAFSSAPRLITAIKQMLLAIDYTTTHDNPGECFLSWDWYKEQLTGALAAAGQLDRET